MALRDEATAAIETEIFRRVLARLEDPRRWTRGASARTADGRVCAPYEGSATCWCLVGALLAETETIWEENYLDAWKSTWALLCRATLARYNMSPQEFNDERGHAAVLSLLNSLISGEPK